MCLSHFAMHWCCWWPSTKTQEELSETCYCCRRDQCASLQVGRNTSCPDPFVQCHRENRSYRTSVNGSDICFPLKILLKRACCMGTTCANAVSRRLLVLPLDFAVFILPVYNRTVENGLNWTGPRRAQKVSLARQLERPFLYHWYQGTRFEWNPLNSRTLGDVVKVCFNQIQAKSLCGVFPLINKRSL